LIVSILLITKIQGIYNINIRAPNIQTKRFALGNVNEISKAIKLIKKEIFAIGWFINPFFKPWMTRSRAKGSLIINKGVANEGKIHFLIAPSKRSKKRNI